MVAVEFVIYRKFLKLAPNVCYFFLSCKFFKINFDAGFDVAEYHNILPAKNKLSDPKLFAFEKKLTNLLDNLSHMRAREEKDGISKEIVMRAGNLGTILLKRKTEKFKPLSAYMVTGVFSGSQEMEFSSDHEDSNSSNDPGWVLYNTTRVEKIMISTIVCKVQVPFSFHGV